MGEWKTVRLGDICKTNTSSYSTNDDWIYVNYLDTGNITHNRINEVQMIDLKAEKLPSRARRKVKYNDIIYSTVRPNQYHYGIIKKQPENFLVSTGFTVISVDPQKANADYIYFYLTKKDVVEGLHAIAEQSTSTYPSIKASDLERVELLLPPVQSQKKIAEILLSIENKMVINNEINENLEQQAQALFKSWFVEFIPFDGTIPVDWIKTDIYSIANIIYGAPFASKLFNTEKHGKPIIRIRDLKVQSFATYTTEIHPKGYLIQAGDIVVGMDGEFRPYIWGNEEAWLNQRVCVFENKRPKGKAFLFCTLKPLLNVIEQTQVATTVIHIGKKDFDAFEVLLPTSDILEKFDSITMPMIEQIASNLLENKKLIDLRNALLPKLMSGELDVSKNDI